MDKSLQWIVKVTSYIVLFIIFERKVINEGNVFFNLNFHPLLILVSLVVFYYLKCLDK